MKKVPKTQEEADALREVVRQNPPVIFGRFVSCDEKGALVTAGFVTDRLSGREVYQAVFDHMQKIKEGEEDEKHEIYVSGEPMLVGWILKHACEIVLYVVLTVIAIFLLLLALLPPLARRGDPVHRRDRDGDLGPRLHAAGGHHLRPAGPRDPDDHHRARRLAHRADGRALLRGLRDHAAALRRPGRAPSSRPRPSRWAS